MRNYSLLEDIYLGDIDKIEANKGKMDVTLSECLLAVKCYSLNPDTMNFDIAKIIFDEYTSKHNSKEDINDLVDLTKNVSKNAENFLIKMVDNENIGKFLVENKFKTTDFIDETLRLDSLTKQDKAKINSLIEIIAFNNVLNDVIPLEKAVDIIDLAKESAELIIAKNNQNSDSKKFAPLAVFLAEDVVETLISNASKKNNIDVNLWDNVQRYDLISIKNANLEEMSDFQGPQHLRETVKGPIYEATWVLLESGLKFGSTSFGDGTHRATCHTDLANGEGIISGGMAYFSEDKKTLLAIDNKTGHYETVLESVFEALPSFEKSDLNIEITIVADFGWDKPKPFKREMSVMDNIQDRIDKMRAKSNPQPSLENKPLVPTNGGNGS